MTKLLKAERIELLIENIVAMRVNALDPEAHAAWQNVLEAVTVACTADDAARKRRTEKLFAEWLLFPRTIGGASFTTLSPPAGQQSLDNPEVQGAMQAFMARKSTSDQEHLLRSHWMLVD